MGFSKKMDYKIGNIEKLRLKIENSMNPRNIKKYKMIV